MGFNKKFFQTGGIVASSPAAAGIDPLQNFETVTYTGNGSTQKITGYIRKGAAFNGSSSYIASAADIGFNDSVSMWFNVEPSGTGTYSLFGRENGGGLEWGGVSLYYDGTDYNLNMQLRSSTGYYLYQAYQNFTLSDGWHHLVFTFDSSSGYTAYIDNSEVTLTTTLSSGTITFPSGTSSIGRVFGNNDPATYFRGKIDQVRIFNKKLSSGEVTTLYGETYASSTKSTTDIFSDNSGVALYELDDSANDTGGTYNGTATNVNFLGMAFQPDLVWIKERSNTAWHILTDSVRGTNKTIYSNDTYQEESLTNVMNSFDTNGFTVAHNASYSSVFANRNNETYVAWCFKGGGAAVSNTDGTITSTVSANQDAGFSIGTYTGNSTAGATIGHGLSSAPELLIVKSTNTIGGSSKAWTVYAEPIGNTKYLYLNTTNAAATYNFWNNTTPTSTVFSLSTDTNVNSSSGNYVFYAFHSVDGYQKVGSYTGDGNANKEITGLGFSPRFVMIKNAGDIGSWIIHSKPPTTTNPSTTHLRANSSAIEDTGANERIDFDSDGFTLVGTGQNINHSDGDTYIYLAIK
jgi:hypothetical protein